MIIEAGGASEPPTIDIRFVVAEVVAGVSGSNVNLIELDLLSWFEER